MTNIGTFQPTSNWEDWSVTIAAQNAAGAGFDLTGYSVQVVVSDKDGCEVLSGSTSDGTVTLAEDDHSVLAMILWTFRAAAMGAIHAARYTVAVRILKAADTIQIVKAALPVVDGRRA